ncbi:MAG: hypothetical protein IPN90_10255 [Elusimicrobia bacterium]|nr:hypothetical protein [Elusimicrobiota bacterium]
MTVSFFTTIYGMVCDPRGHLWTPGGELFGNRQMAVIGPLKGVVEGCLDIQTLLPLPNPSGVHSD